MKKNLNEVFVKNFRGEEITLEMYASHLIYAAQNPEYYFLLQCNDTDNENYEILNEYKEEILEEVKRYVQHNQ